MRLKYLKSTKMFENVLKKLINSYLNFKKKKNVAATDGKENSDRKENL